LNSVSCPRNPRQYYYTNDANFNVTALVGTDGDVAERVAYDPYGKVPGVPGAGYATPAPVRPRLMACPVPRRVLGVKINQDERHRNS